MRSILRNGACLREFLRYTTFSVLGTLGISCYILADTYFIAKGLGSSGLAALNLAIPVYNLIYGSGLMLGMGGATMFSIYSGRGEKNLANVIYSNAVCLSLGISLLFFLAGCLWAEPMAQLLGADASILPMTRIYLKWLLLFSPAFMMNTLLQCFVRNDGGPQLSMAAMITGSVANILLDYIFIFPLDMGMLGAVLATGISPVVSMIMMLPHWMRGKNHVTFHLARLQREPVKQAMALGVPSLISQLSGAMVMILFNLLILGLEGNTGVAAYGVVANIAIVTTAIINGIAQGAQPLLSRFYGIGDKKQERAVTGYAMKTAILTALLLYLLLTAFAAPITAAFNSEEDKALQEIAEEGMKLYFLSLAATGANTVFATLFTSVEMALPAQILSLLRGVLLLVPAVFGLAYLFGMPGVWLSFPVAEGAAVCYAVAAYRKYGRSNPRHQRGQNTF